MIPVNDETLLQLLQACADAAPEPLYPARYAQEKNLDRDSLDEGLDELRRRGLIKLTDWVKERGQGRTLTEAGTKALTTKRLTPAQPIAPNIAAPSPQSPYERGEIVRRAIFATAPPYVCWTLLAINIVVFFLGALYAWQANLGFIDYLVGKRDDTNLTGTALRQLGGICRPDIFPSHGQRPQFERLITGCFLHLGLLHLGMNMFFLATLGGVVESMWGRWRFLAIYFIAAVASSCVVLIVDADKRDNEVYVTVGASGALFGVAAALVVWFSLNYRHLPDHAIEAWSRTIGINLMLMVAVNFVGGVSWQGHLGGAIGGLLAALLLHVQRFHPSRALRIFALLALPLIPAAFFALALWQAGWF